MNNYYSRYFIVKEGLFKNKKKILNVSNNNFTIENSDGTESETISFEAISFIKYSEKNSKEFQIKYKNNLLTFSCDFRLNLICDLITQIDLCNSINQFPIEIFQCVLICDIALKTIRFDANIKVNRSMIEIIIIENKKEIKFKLYEIECVHINKKENYAIFNMTNKGKYIIEPSTKTAIKIDDIINKILENGKKFLGYTLKVSLYDEKSSALVEGKEINDSTPPTPKNCQNLQNSIQGSQISQIPQSFQAQQRMVKINRVLFINIKIPLEVNIENDEMIVEYDLDGSIYSVTQVETISCLITHENTDNFFEIILEDNSRMIFESSPNEKNILLTRITECLLNKKGEGSFLLLSSIPRITKKIKGFPDNIPDYGYESYLCKEFVKDSNQESFKQVVEDACLNSCYKDDTPQMREEMFEPSFKEKFKQKFKSELSSSVEMKFHQLSNKENSILERNKINFILTMLRFLGIEFYHDEEIKKLITKLLTTTYVSIFYNAICLLKSLLSIHSSTKSKKELNAVKTEIINASITPKFFTLYCYDKIFDSSTSSLIPDFESKNILYLHSILRLELHLFDTLVQDSSTLANVVTNLCEFRSLFLLYKLIRCNTIVLRIKAIDILLKIIQNLTIEQEYQLKTKILTQTIIFFTVLLEYIHNEKETKNLSLKFLKSLLISHVECTNLINNLFPLTLFYNIEDKPNPINWLSHEWDEFFGLILNDYSETKLIWNQSCRQELAEYLNALISSYEEFTNNNNVVKAFYDNFAEGEDVNRNTSYFSLNYKEIKIEYNVLRKEAFVWQYYLRKIINERGEPSLACEIEKPNKFWKKLKRGILESNSEHQLILMLKTMILLYKNYYESIGVFKEYQLFIKFYKSTSSLDIKCFIIQLFITSIKLTNKEFSEQNIKIFVNNIKGTEVFIHFISDIIANAGENLNKEFSKTINLDEIIQKEINSYYIDSKSPIVECPIIDEKFANYTCYLFIDDASWISASKETKTITLVIFFYKLLLKKNPILLFENDEFKIQFPMPKMKTLFCEEKNYKTVLKLLLIANENLTQEVLNLFIRYLNDPLTYFHIGHKFYTVDILFLFMIKYKSKNIFDLIGKLYSFHTTFFGLQNVVKVTKEENEFYLSYPNANKFLSRYFPISVVYFSITHDFEELMSLIFEYDGINEEDENDVVWGKEMLSKLVKSLTDLVVQSKEMEFDPNFKIDYKSNQGQKFCYLYNMNSIINDIGKIKHEHINSMIRILIDQIEDVDYVTLLYRIIKKYNETIDKKLIEDIYVKTIELYDKIILLKKNKENEEDESNEVLLYDIKILILINEAKFKPKALEGLSIILSQNSLSTNSEKIIVKMIDYINLKKYFNDSLIEGICKKISEMIIKLLSHKKLIISFMNLFYSMSESKTNILLQTALPYQFIYVCAQYSDENPKSGSLMSLAKNSIFLVAFKILKNLVSQSLEFGETLSKLFGNVLYEVFTKCGLNSNDFLIKFTSEHKNPIFIWNKKLLEELENFLDEIAHDIQNGKFDKGKVDNFHYKAYSTEMIINGVYLSVYNKYPTFVIKNVNQFLLKLLNEFNDKERKHSLDDKKQILFSLCNCIEHSKGDINLLLKDEYVFGKFLNFCESGSDTFVAVNFIYILTLYENSIDYVYDPNITYCLIFLIERNSSRNFVEKIKSILTSLMKKSIEKVNLSIFLFLLKKLILLRDMIQERVKTAGKGKNLDGISQIRLIILNLICLFSKNSEIWFALRRLYECYLPSKIIDNLFNSQKTPATASLSKWLDNELELPDLIWNNEAFLLSQKLLEDDCSFILKDITNLDNFPNNFFNYKISMGLTTKKSFFFEIADEYILDGIYLRLFNKEPNYNIGINLINFITDVSNDAMLSLEIYSIFLHENIHQETNHYFHQKLLTSFTTIMLCIEQINYNDFNQNLGIANMKELNNVTSNKSINTTNETIQGNLLLSLIQRSFEYQKLLNEDICKMILKMQIVFFGTELALKFPNDLRLIYLQILYLLSMNKARSTLFSSLFRSKIIINHYIKNCETVSDFEIVLLICILNKLLSVTSSGFVNEFIFNYLEGLCEVAQKRKKFVKYVELMILNILNDSQYSDWMKAILKKEDKKELFSSFSVSNNSFNKSTTVIIENVDNIWRNVPKDNEEANSIYSINTNEVHYYDEIEIDNDEEFVSKFPIICKKAINCFNYKEFNSEELEEIKDKIVKEKYNGYLHLNEMNKGTSRNSHQEAKFNFFSLFD